MADHLSHHALLQVPNDENGAARVQEIVDPEGQRKTTQGDALILLRDMRRLDEIGPLRDVGLQP